MPFLIDRRHALYGSDLVAALNVHQRRVRSRVILKDNSLYHTLTRTQTLVRYTNGSRAAIIRIGSRRGRGTDKHTTGAAWQEPP